MCVVHFTTCETVPQFRRFVTSLKSRRPGLEPRLECVGFVVDTMVLGPIFSNYLGFPSQLIQLLHIQQISYHKRYVISIVTESLKSYCMDQCLLYSLM
jgi:hypothetical protein